MKIEKQLTLDAVKLTLDIVKETATYLIKKNSNTTSLEVKKRLQDLGYWAVQVEVSKHLKQLVHLNVLQSSKAPLHDYLIYTLADKQPQQLLFDLLQDKKEKEDGYNNNCDTNDVSCDDEQIEESSSSNKDLSNKEKWVESSKRKGLFFLEETVPNSHK